jgi:hypothetical protein
VARGRPDAGATARCRGRPIPERAAPSFNARERTGSGAPRADDASWRVVRARWRAVLMCKGATLATGRSNPRAQGRLPGRGVGPGWGRPAPRPSTHRRAAGPDGFHLSIREPARGGASPQTRAPGDAAPSAGRRATAPCRAEGPQSRRARARPLGRAHLPHRRPRRCVVFFAKNRPSGGAAVLPTRVRGVSLALIIPAVCRPPPLPERRPALSTIYPGSRHDASPMCANGRRTRGARSAPRPGPAPLVRTLSYLIGTPRVDGPARRVYTAAHASGGRVRRADVPPTSSTPGS